MPEDIAPLRASYAGTGPWVLTWCLDEQWSEERHPTYRAARRRLEALRDAHPRDAEGRLTLAPLNIGRVGWKGNPDV